MVISKMKLIGAATFIIVLNLLLSSCGQRTKTANLDTPTSGLIQISVDESFKPIINLEVDVFESIYSLAGIVPIYTNEVEALNLLLKDSVRLSIATRTLSDAEKKTLENKKLFVKEVKIAIDALALIVNKQNPDSLITVSQLGQILKGELTQWKDLSASSKLGKLQFVFDNPNSSTIRYAIDSINQGGPLATTLNAMDTNEAVIDYVAKTPNAIGVIGVCWVGSKSDSALLSTFSERVTVMNVSKEEVATRANSFKPYQAYLSRGDYPLTRNVYAISTDPKSGLASGFASFLASDRGQRIILKTGIVPATQNIRFVETRDSY